jgi:hypothetical protein
MKTSYLAIVPVLLVSSLAVQQQVPGKDVLVRNSETVNAAFGLSCDDKKSWRPVELKAGDSQLFKCDSGDAKMWIHINTDIADAPHRECEIRLEDKKRYEIFFDGDQKKWDLRQM